MLVNYHTLSSVVIIHFCNKEKQASSYIARYPVLMTAQSALHFIPWQNCIARYSFIQLSELWQRGVIKLAKGSNRSQWDLKPGSIH